MEQLDYIIILLYFSDLIAVSVCECPGKSKTPKICLLPGEILRGGCRESLPT